MASKCRLAYWVDRCIALVAALLTVLAVTQFAGHAVTINSELNAGVMGPSLRMPHRLAA